MREPTPPPWSLPLGEQPDPDQAALLVATFRGEAVRVGRILRRRMERERPHGYARCARIHGIGLAHLAYAVIDAARWYPEDGMAARSAPVVARGDG